MKLTTLITLATSTASGAVASKIPSVLPSFGDKTKLALAKKKADEMKMSRISSSAKSTSSECDWETEETCYDDEWNVIGCEPYAEGGCPCPDGQARCGGDEFWLGYCTSLCCDWETEDTCYSRETWEPTSCAAWEDGGCPCEAGEAKCNAFEDFPGYCTDFCCEGETDYCFNENGEVFCGAWADGGCPCLPGEVKCGAEGAYPGYCTDLCCEFGYCWDPTNGYSCADDSFVCPSSSKNELAISSLSHSKDSARMGALIHALKIKNKEFKKVKENERVSFFRAMKEANKIKQM